jgi:hypothetical protein
MLNFRAKLTNRRLAGIALIISENDKDKFSFTSISVYDDRKHVVLII